MITLPNNYTKNGYNHEVIFREKEYVISKLTSMETGHFICYEAFRVIVAKPFTLKGVFYGEREQTPSNEHWGKYGFSVHTLEKAHKRIEDLKQRAWKNGKKDLTQS